MANPTYEKQGTCGSHNQTCKQLGLRVPYRRPSGGVAQGGKRPGRPRKAESGQGGPVSAGPRSGTGAREVWPPKAARPGCRGALSLWLLSLCACKEKVTDRKSVV